MRKVSSGRSFPLGSTVDAEGVNFALFSANATKVQLCLFNEDGSEELERYEMPEHENNIWHIYIKGLKAGQVYGYRVYGEYNPAEGKRFNPNKLLYDPYGKKFVGKLIWDKAIFGYDPDSPQKDLSFSNIDSAPYVPKSVVVADDFDWQDVKNPQIPFEKTIIYEAHTKGLTKLAPKIEKAYRGKFLGISSPSGINYLKWLGITAIELLPIHAFFADVHKDKKAKRNYWGYETYSFFAPEPSYLACDDISEFKQMVKALHTNNIEVLLDVVYNHTGEGNQLGPTLCYRGIDNETYYTLDRNNKRYYYDSTGCGASFNLQNPTVMTLVMDSLRYWVREMGVDGFRFDLASSLSRKNEQFTQDSGFLQAIRQDEVLRNVKLIAEPWDLAEGGYQLGAFPPNWAEWNDRYRDTIRRFWKGDEGVCGQFASRISGSSDIFGYNDRKISSSVNFITAHDGFNLRDLVSYNDKHNFANGEENRDGNNSNNSWNNGQEGETEDESIKNMRLHRAKAMMATLLFSFGTPMILAGDEIYRTMFGNNNPYCQDNILNWLVWDGIEKNNIDFARFIRKLIMLRKKLKVFYRKKFFTGETVENLNHKDIVWYRETGDEFNQSDWDNQCRKAESYCVFDDVRAVLYIFNANTKDMRWILPELKGYSRWNLRVDTAEELKEDEFYAGKEIDVPAWSVVVFEVKK